MNYSLSILKKALLSAAILSLIIVVSCKREAVEPIPDIEIDPGDAFTEPDPIQEADLDNITAESIDFTPGDVQIPGTEGFDPASNPAGAIQDANALDNVLTAANEAFWDNVTPAQILALIEAGDQQILSNLAQLLTTFQNDPRLSRFVPTVINPSVNLGRLGAPVEDASSPGNRRLPPGRDIFAAVDQDFNDDCFQGIQDTFEELRAPLDQQLQEQLDAIATRYNSELGTLTTERDALLNSAQARYEADLVTYLQEYNRINTSIQSAFAAAAISDRERFLLVLLNKIIYGLNVLASFDLRNTENDLIIQGFQSGLAELNDNREVEEQRVTDSYDEQVAVLRDEAEQAFLLCHNQGGSSGG